MYWPRNQQVNPKPQTSLRGPYTLKVGSLCFCDFVVLLFQAVGQELTGVGEKRPVDFRNQGTKSKEYCVQLSFRISRTKYAYFQGFPFKEKQ